MLRSLVLTLLTLAAPAAAKTADEAYEAARVEYQKLKGDEKRRALRHHWQNVAKRFEALATKYGQSERAPEALFNAGELYNELARFSGRDDDRDAAKRSYRKLIDGWPKHRLSDDAALALAKVLADREGDPAGARRVLEAAQGGANDKKRSIKAMLALLPVAAPPKPKPAAVARAEAPPARGKAPVAGPSAAAEAPDDEARQPAPVARARAEKLPAAAGAERPAQDVMEAIRRAVSRVDVGQDPLTVQARRAPPQGRPSPDEVPERKVDADDVDEADEPVVASLAERLRDVRVGARSPGADAEAKSRFKKLAKAQAGDELTLAQQLGLKVRRVVIDAGHGGHDTGAIGAEGTREKDVSLSISKKLASKLEAQGLEVVLTRDDDTYLKLEERTRIANREKGDLFISIHCNAAPSKAMRGIETYTLNTSSNRYSIRLAARENATTERGVGDLQYILADLATKANTGESAQLADRVQRSLVRDLSRSHKGVRDLGTKEALFFVLLGARMPAILVETSFLSNAEEEQRLASDEYQTQIADSIAEAVEGFLSDRNKLAQID